jgi:hypothetical protein
MVGNYERCILDDSISGVMGVLMYSNGHGAACGKLEELEAYHNGRWLGYLARVGVASGSRHRRHIISRGLLQRLNQKAKCTPF